MKRKYTKHGEKPISYECTKKKCRWQGTDKEKDTIKNSDGWSELVCPNCGNNEFYGLL